MSENANPPTTPVPPEKPGKRKRLRRFLVAIAVLPVGIIGLALLAPTLLSLGPGRSIVLGIVNKKLNGRVDVADWSLGWFSGVHVTGLQLSDAAGRHVASVQTIAIPMPLWHAVTGKYPIGDSKIDGVKFDAVVAPDGSLNFSRLVKSAPTTASEPTTVTPSRSDGFSIPPVFGSLTVGHVQGTYSRPNQPVLAVDSLDAIVTLPQGDGAITVKADSSVRAGTQPATTVAIDVTQEIKRRIATTLGSGKATATARAAGDSADSINLGLTVSQVGPTTIALHLDTGKADWVRLNKQFALLPAEFSLTGGASTVALDATFDSATSTVVLKPLDAGVTDVTLNRVDKAGKPVLILQNWAIKTHVEGSASFGSVVGATVHSLNLTDSLNLLSVKQSGPADLAFTRSAAGEFGGPGGTVAITLDVPQIVSLLEKYQGGAAPTADDIRIKSAWDTQTLTVTPEKTDLHIVLAGGVHQLIISGPGGDTAPAEVPISLDVAVAPDFSKVDVKQAGVSSPFVAVSVTDAVISLAGKTPLQKLLKATIHTDVPDLKTTMAGAEKFQKPEKPVPGQPTVLPRIFDAGSVSGTTQIVSSGSGLDVTTCVVAKDIASHTGTAASQKLEPVSLRSHLILSPTTAGDDYNVDVKTLTAGFDQTKSLILSIADGSIGRVETARDLKLTANLSYDLSALMPQIKPYLSAGMQSMNITGVANRQVVIGGSYPAGKPFKEAVKTLAIDGSAAVDSLDYDGVKTDKPFVLAFAVHNGILTTTPATPQSTENVNTIYANSGQIHVDRLQVNLTADTMRLSTPAEYVFIEHFTINPIFSQAFLAGYLKNFLFIGTGDTTGLLFITFKTCDRLPLGDLVNKATPDNDGSIDILDNITSLHLGISNAELKNAFKGSSIEGDVKDGTVKVAHGLMVEHFPVASSAYAIVLDGTIRLADESMMPMTLNFPLSFVAKAHITQDQTILSLIPNSLPITVTGPVHQARFDFSPLGKVVQNALANGGQKELQNKLLNGKKPQDAATDLLNQFGKKKK